MNFITIAIASSLLAPSFAQTQTIVETVDVSGSSAAHGSLTAEVFHAPVVPGKVVGVTLDLTIDYQIDATVSNQIYQAPVTGTLNRNRLNAFPGAAQTYVDFLPAHVTSGIWVPNSIPIPFGQSVNITDSWSSPFTPTHWDWPLDEEATITIGDRQANSFNGNNPQGWMFWVGFNPVMLSSSSNDTVQVNGALTWEWEPFLPSVSTVCPGDGVMELSLVGEWGRDARVVSNYIDNFSLLFRGDFFQHPGTSLCIGSAERITPSLRGGSMDYSLDPSTLIVGQTFVLQAAHRFGNGQVRISNALLVTPQ